MYCYYKKRNQESKLNGSRLYEKKNFREGGIKKQWLREELFIKNVIEITWVSV